jgi:uncharacterized membrane protein YqjE
MEQAHAAAGRDHRPAGRRPAGLGELLGHLVGEAKSLVADFAHLAILDARRAALSLAWLLASVLIVAVLLVTAWMGGLAALIVLMYREGISWPLALSGIALLNVAGAAALAWWMRNLIAELPFEALLRQLRGEPAPERRDEPERSGNEPRQ